MINELSRFLPRHPLREISYSADYLIAFLPSIIITCLFLTKNILTGLFVSLLCAFILELAYSFFMKKEVDITLFVRVLALCICIPCESSLVIYALGGILIFGFSTLRGFTDKYVSFEPVTYAMLILLLILSPISSPTHSVVNGMEFGNTAVWDLLVGYKSSFFGAGNLFALTFAYIYLSIRKRINFIYGLLFYVALIATLAFLYEDGMLNAIYYVSFIALDARVFFGSLFLLNNGPLPFEKNAAYLFSVLGGGALGLITLKLGMADGIYYIIALLSLIARPAELLICKFKHAKKDTDI